MTRKYDITRRGFIKKLVGVLGVITTSGLALAGYIKSAKDRAIYAIRPPGALENETEFQGACVRCGLCVEACPYDILTLATLDDPVPTGTPYFVARAAACEMCEDIPCVKACPTGALDHALTDITKSDMGLAAFIDPETCYARQGTACRACYVACPIKDEAITMKKMIVDGKIAFEPTVISDACTGCGKCEEACLTPEASIKVFPRRVLKDDIGVQHHA